MYFYKTKTFKGPAPEDWIIEAENDLALKKAQLEDAQYAVDRLEDGPNADDILAAQARVDAAQATVDSMSILAPFDGQVLYVASQPGDLVSAGAAAAHVADMDHLYVEAQVDESDVADVSLGQPADVTLDALSDVTLTGAVAAINPVGEEISGLVKYTVRIDLDPVDDQAFIPLGTTANITIHIREATMSLAVPITTIQNDANGEFVMVSLADGSSKRVDVVSGAIVDDMVVVTGDLQEGDRVLVNDASSFNAPNPFGGGGQ
jgi:HlyD family secretion protein